MLINTSETDSKYEDKLRAIYKFINSVYLAYVDFLENRSKKNLETLIKHCKGLNPPVGFKKYQELLAKELEDIYLSYDELSKDDFDLKVIDLIAKKAQSAIRTCNSKLATIKDQGSDFSDIDRAETSLSLNAVRSIKKNYITVTKASVIPIGAFNYEKMENSFDCKTVSGYIQMKNQVLIVINQNKKPLDIEHDESIEQALARLEEQTNQSWMLVANSGISVQGFKNCIFYWAMSHHDVDKLRECCAQKRLLLSGWSLI